MVRRLPRGSLRRVRRREPCREPRKNLTVTGAQPTDENIEHGLKHGFRLNMMFIDMPIEHNFSVVVVCIGLAASK